MLLKIIKIHQYLRQKDFNKNKLTFGTPIPYYLMDTLDESLTNERCSESEMHAKNK